MKHKPMRRILAGLLAGMLCLSMTPGAAFADDSPGADTQAPEAVSAAATPETASPEQEAATPETAASAARFSFTVLDADYEAPASGNIDESLFGIDADEARMPAGEAVPVLLQVVDPAPDSTVTVTLSDGAVFTDSEMAADNGSTYTRNFTSGEQASAWMLYVRSDGDFTAEATYAGLDGESLTRTISVTRYHKISLFSVFSARAGGHQYHITDVTNVGGEWLITFEGEDQSYCLDQGMNGKPSASVYWTYYGTTDLLDQARAAGCSSKLDIQRYVWAHRQEASNSGGAYVYQASEAGWQNVMTTYPPVDQPTEPEQPEETPPPTYDASWSVNVSERASAEFAVSMTVAVDKTAAITGERLDDAEITVTPNPASGNLDGGSWSVSPDHEIIRTVNGDGSVTFSYKGSVTKSASRSDSGSVSGAASQEEADAAAESERAQAESALRAEARADAQNQANAAAAEAAKQARKFLVKETGVPHGFSSTDSSEQTVTVQPNGSATAAIQNQPWRATVRWEKLDALTGGRLTEDTKFVLYEWSAQRGGYEVSPNYRVVRLADGTYSVTVSNDSYAGWQAGCVYYTQDNLGKFKIEETVSAYGYTDATQDGAGPWSVEFIIDKADKVVEYLGENADRNRPWGNRVVIHKTDSETGQAIAANAKFTLYEWNAARGVYEVSTNYAIERAGDGSYTVACLHPDWTLAEAGQLYFEDTLCDTRADTANHDGTTSQHAVYYGDIDLKQYPNDRAFTNDGQFLIVETQAPNGYFGDWTNAVQPGTSGSDLGKRAYYLRLTGDGSTITLDNAAYNADILTENQGGVLVETPDGTVTVQIYDKPKDATRNYATDSTGLANNEDSYTSTPVTGKFTNDRAIGEIVLTKADLDQLQESVPRALTDADSDNSAIPGGALHGTASIEGAVYDLYAAEDIQHPDGVTGTVDYSKIVDANGNPIWHTTVLTNGGWDTDYLPILAKDHLVASAEIKDGVLAFANLYLGKYYLVERATGIVLPLDGDGQYYVSGQYPVLDRTLQATGEYKPLATNSRGEYTDYVYKNQYSAVAEGRALTGVKTYDGYYLSYAEGYLCDEINHYSTLAYGSEAQYIIRGDDHSNDAVLKSGFELRKVVSTTGPGSPAPKLEGAGFTVYRIWDLSKVDEFQKNADGTYNVQSILDAYRKDNYDNTTSKYDFSGENQAIARMFESDASLVAEYNASLTAAYDYANGQGDGWVPTQNTNEYTLSELFTNEEGVIRVTGLPYGQYLVVETTLPKDLFQADPFVVTVDSSAPQSVMCQPDGSVTTPSNSYMTYNVLNEELEGYLQLIKIDAETGKPVKIADTAFQIYRIAEDGTETLLEMPDPDSGSATAKTSTFYTDADGYLKTPEKLPLGRYRVVEIEGPEGFFNDEQYNVVFELTSERVWEVVGNATDDMDDFVITEEYSNHETLSQLTIRKVGNVLTGYENGQFIYEQTNLAGATYEIRAHDDIATGDRQGTLWYADGDLVATVTTGEAGQVDEVKFSPTRTPATYDFLSVSHNGTTGEVTITLPLGSYDITEVQAPYGFVHTAQTYTVTFGWDNQTNDIVLAQTIVDHTQDGDETYSYDIVNVSNANEDQLGNLPGTIVFENARVLPVVEEGRIGVGVYKLDRSSANMSDDQPYLDGVKTDPALLAGGSNHDRIPEGAILVPGATYELYTADDIYSLDGTLLAAADTLLATATTGEDGLAYFPVDVPIRGEKYGSSDAHNWTTNSGRYYIREVAVPDGYLIEQSDIPVEFTYEGQTIAWQVVDCLHSDKQTEITIDKQAFASADPDATFALPGATLTITDWDGNVVDQWETSDTAHVVHGLHLNQSFAPDYADDLGKVYTLTETRPADGYTTARSIQVYLKQASDNGIYAQKTELWVRETVANAEYQSGSIISPVTFADKEPGLLQRALDAVTSFFTGTNGTDAQDGVVIANWVCVNSTLTVTFTDDATEAAIAKCLHERDFATLDFDKVYLVGGTAPDFFPEQQVAEKPAGSEIVYTADWHKAEGATITMVDAPTRIRISKLDIVTGEEVPGAELQIVDSDGNVVESWTSGTEPHPIEGKLVAGATYTLVETLAPTAEGYVPAQSIQFTVEDDGKVQQVFMQDDYTKVSISKTDIATGAEVPGAHLQIVDGEGNILAEWVTDGTPHYIERLPVGTLTLIETQAPTEDGYVRAENVTFEVLPTGEIQQVEMKDDFTKVEISKKDITNGDELRGAHLRISDADGNVVAEWTTDGQPHRIDRLQPGKYILTETAAPNGYKLAESVRFVVEESGRIQKVTMYDAPVGTFTITKLDETSNTALAGAQLSLVDGSGNTIDRWQTTGAPHVLPVLTAEDAAKDPRVHVLLFSTDTIEYTYTLVEEGVPTGYLAADSITFKLMQVNGELTMFLRTDTGWQKAEEPTLRMFDARNPNAPVPEVHKTFPQTGEFLSK